MNSLRRVEWHRLQSVLSSQPQTKVYATLNHCRSKRDCLAKDVANLINQALIFQIFVFDNRKLFKKFSLFAGQRRWRDDANRNKQVAVAATAKHGHAFIL